MTVLSVLLLGALTGTTSSAHLDDVVGLMQAPGAPPEKQENPWSVSFPALDFWGQAFNKAVHANADQAHKVIEKNTNAQVTNLQRLKESKRRKAEPTAAPSVTAISAVEPTPAVEATPAISTVPAAPAALPEETLPPVTSVTAAPAAPEPEMLLSEGKEEMKQTLQSRQLSARQARLVHERELLRKKRALDLQLKHSTNARVRRRAEQEASKMRKQALETRPSVIRQEQEVAARKEAAAKAKAKAAAPPKLLPPGPFSQQAADARARARAKEEAIRQRHSHSHRVSAVPTSKTTAPAVPSVKTAAATHHSSTHHSSTQHSSKGIAGATPSTHHSSTHHSSKVTSGETPSTHHSSTHHHSKGTAVATPSSKKTLVASPSAKKTLAATPPVKKTVQKH